MKMLILADAEAWHTERYVKELRLQGHTVSLASVQSSELVDQQLPPVKYSAAITYMSHVRLIKRLIDELQPEVVNSHFASAYGVMAARCRRRFGNCGAYWPLTVWGSDILVNPLKSYLHRRRAEYALGSADVILADSTYLQERTEALTETSVKIIPWGIERRYLVDDTTVKQKAQLLNVKENRRQLKLIAPRPHRKLYNNEYLLHALLPLLLSGKATLTVNSTGALFESFMKLVGQLEIKEAVSVYQPCSRGAYLKLFGEHDIYLSAATSDSSPVSLIEALALGVAPVCAQHPGLSDLLVGESASSGVYLPNSKDGPLDAINNVIGLDQNKREQLLRANRDLAQTTAVYEDNIAETVRLFERGVAATTK